jgi:hypothetical protein
MRSPLLSLHFLPFAPMSSPIFARAGRPEEEGPEEEEGAAAADVDAAARRVKADDGGGDGRPAAVTSDDARPASAVPAHRRTSGDRR